MLVIGLGSAVPLASQSGGGSPITFDENMFGGGNFQAGKFIGPRCNIDILFDHKHISRYKSEVFSESRVNILASCKTMPIFYYDLSVIIRHSIGRHSNNSSRKQNK